MRDVVFVTQTAYVGGGMEHWLVALSEGLQRLGRRVRVVLVEGPRFHCPEHFLKRHAIAVPTTVVRAQLGLREERVSVVLDLLSNVSNGIIIPVGVADAADAVGVGKRMGMDLRLVCCLHGNAPVATNEISRCAGDVDFAVSVSCRGANELVAAGGLPPSRIRHIPFGVEVPTLTTKPRRADSSLNVAYVGRLDHGEKRVRDLIGIVVLMRSHPFILEIVGEGPERPGLEQALRDDVASGRVRFRGYVEPARLRSEIYSMIDALIILSPAEGGPITAWEAMAHGVIPVTSDFLGRREEPIWQPERNCLVFPVGDVALAAAQLTRLLNLDFRARLGASAAELPAAYRRDSFARAWQEVIVEVGQTPSRQARVPARIPTSPGRLARFPRLRATLRRVQLSMGTLPSPPDAGSEWPRTYFPASPVSEK